MRFGMIMWGMFMLLAVSPASAQDREQGTPSEGAKAPLRDLRIDEKKIPPVLQRAASAPYSSEGTRTCAQLRTAIRELDTALGPDADAATGKNGNGGDIAAAGSRALVGTLIPGFGLVRLLTGANKQERRVEAAILGGSIRRAYLKGLGASKGCTPPAAPAAAARAAKPQLPAEDDDAKDDEGGAPRR